MACFKSLATALLLTSVAATAVANDNEQFSYVPNFHGAIRARWEMNTQEGDWRFQVRNARFTIDGKIAPSIDYFIQTDLCDQGKMKILDAYGRFRIVKGLTVQGGQFRMPFGVETFRAPANYIFANRSYMGKQMMNYRAVGAKAAYSIPKTGLTLEAGVFNPTAIGEQGGWHKSAAWSAKALYKLPEGFSLSGGYASIKPADIRANLADACLTWENKHWLIAGEYMYEHYCGNPYADAHSYVAFADYRHPVKAGVFNQWSVQARFDGLTDHHSLALGHENNSARNRLTIGATMTYKYKALHADVRANYEQMLQWQGAGKRPNLFVAELVVRF